MNSRVGMDLETCREKVRVPFRQAWVDSDGKIISFHPIDSGRLLEADDPAFWEEVIFLSNIGYRIQ